MFSNLGIMDLIQKLPDLRHVGILEWLQIKPYLLEVYIIKDPEKGISHSIFKLVNSLYETWEFSENLH